MPKKTVEVGPGAVCHDYKPGDLVVLRSGGPKMTVETTAVNSVICLWFEGKRLRKKEFMVSMLHSIAVPTIKVSTMDAKGNVKSTRVITPDVREVEYPSCR